MKKSKKLPCLYLGTGLLCFGAWTTFPQAGPQPKPTTTVAVATNKLPTNALSQLTPPPSNSSAGGNTPPPQPSEIKTQDGKIYKNVTVQRVDPDGLTVGFTNGGGISIAKIKFKNLPEGQQRQYNYDSNKAAAYETKQAQGMAAWRVQQQKQDAVTKQTIIRRDKQDALEQQQKELEQQQRKAEPKMTEEQKREAKKQIEATWLHMTTAVKAGRITN